MQVCVLWFVYHFIIIYVLGVFFFFFFLACLVQSPLLVPKVENLPKGRELNLPAILASQPAAGHSLSFVVTVVIMTLGWGLFVGLTAESCGRIWPPCLRSLCMRCVLLQLSGRWDNGERHTQSSIILTFIVHQICHQFFPKVQSNLLAILEFAQQSAVHPVVSVYAHSCVKVTTTVVLLRNVALQSAEEPVVWRRYKLNQKMVVSLVYIDIP